MVDKPKISINRYLGGLGRGSKSWNVKNDCKIHEIVL
jgi:hypothetical protein